MNEREYDSEVVAPSSLSAADIAAWHAMMAATPSLQRGFFAPEFARACERAHGRARVAVFRRGDVPVAFFPFQFASRWHMALGSAERIGGVLCDHAGLIAEAGFQIALCNLLQAARLHDIHLSHVPDVQAAFGLDIEGGRVGHHIDLANGPDAYLSKLAAERRGFISDTERRLRKAEQQYGPLRFTFDAAPELAAAHGLLAQKRRQYIRTGAGDVFADPRCQAIINALFDRPRPQCRPVMASLTVGQHELGRHLGLLSGGVLSYWFPVYDPEAKAVSPGRLLLWHTIRAAPEHGIKLIDRGVGDTQAKRDFSNATQHFGEIAAHRHGPRAFLARAERSIRWRLRGGAVYAV